MKSLRHKATQETAVVEENVIPSMENDTVEIKPVETVEPAVEETPVITRNVDATPKETPTPTAAQTSKTEEVVKDYGVYTPLFSVMKNNRKAVEQAEGFLSRFNAYVTALRPGVPVNNADTAARADMTFWKAIQAVMNIEDFATFRAVWGVVLLTVKENMDGVFHDRYVDRFKSHWTLSKVEAETRDAVFNMMKLTCDPATRAQGLKSFDMGRTLKGLTANQGQNITLFYETR